MVLGHSFTRASANCCSSIPLRLAALEAVLIFERGAVGTFDWGQ